MPTNITVKNLPTGYQTIISNGKHSLIADEPISI
jgi:putative redox protein